MKNNSYSEMVLKNMEEIKVEGLNNNNKIHACVYNNGNLLNREIGLIVKFENNRLSDLITCKIKNLQRTIKDFEHSGLGFSGDDCKKLYSSFDISKLKVVDAIEKADHETLLAHVYGLAEERKNPLNKYIDGGCANIPVREFAEIADKVGYKSLEARKLLKKLGLLETNEGRTYDYNVRLDGKKPRAVIRIRIVEISVKLEPIKNTSVKSNITKKKGEYPNLGKGNKEKAS